MKRISLIIPVLFLFTGISFAQMHGQSIIDSLLTELLKANDDTNKVNVYIELSIQYMKISNYKTSDMYADSVYKLSDKLGFKTGIIKAYYSRGKNYWFQHRMPDALGSYQSALKVAKEINDSSSIAAAYCRIGAIYDDQNNMPKALDNYLLALKISEAINDKKEIAICHNDMAMIYASLKDYTEALNHCQAAIKIEEENHDKGIASSEENMASVFTKQGSYDEALRYYLDAVKTPAQEHDEWGLANNFNLIGNVYMLKGDYPTSTDYFENALEISLKYNYIDLQASGYYSLCELAIRQHRIAEANNFLQKDLVLQKQIGGSGALGDAYEMLSRIDSLEGNYKNAYLNYHLALKYRDSTITEETARKIENARMNFEVSKKEAAAKAEQDKKDALATEEIKRQTIIKNATLGGVGIAGIFSFLLVRSANRRRKTTFDKRVAEVEMKALRSQMNPHFIFNSLQSIQTFLSDRNLEDTEAYLVKFSKLMRLVLENSQHQEVPLTDDLQALELYMQLESLRIRHPFTFEIKIDEDIDQEDTVIPPLILQPFVENAIWHGLHYKDEPGHISIDIRKKGEELIYIVEDDGVGRKASKEMKSAMQMKKQSLGMKLTEERLKLLTKMKKVKSYFSVIDLVTDNQPAGTRVELLMPA